MFCRTHCEWCPQRYAAARMIHPEPIGQFSHSNSLRGLWLVQYESHAHPLGKRMATSDWLPCRGSSDIAYDWQPKVEVWGNCWRGQMEVKFTPEHSRGGRERNKQDGGRSWLPKWCARTVEGGCVTNDSSREEKLLSGRLAHFWWECMAMMSTPRPSE